MFRQLRQSCREPKTNNYQLPSHVMRMKDYMPALINIIRYRTTGKQQMTFRTVQAETRHQKQSGKGNLYSVNAVGSCLIQVLKCLSV